MSDHDTNDPELIERIHRDLARLPVADLPSPAPVMERGRRRKRIAFVRTSVLAALLAAALIVPLVQLSGLRGNGRPGPVSPPGPSPSHPEIFRATGTPPLSGLRCPTPARPVAYNVNIQPAAGAPGSTVFVTGNTPLFSPAARYIGPTGKIGFWFNLPPNGWENIYSTVPAPTANSGAPIVHLGEASVQGRCSYRVTFTVPDMPPGSYPLVLIEHVHGSSSAFEPINFEVTAPNLDPNYTPAARLLAGVIPAYPASGVLTQDPGWFNSAFTPTDAWAYSEGTYNVSVYAGEDRSVALIIVLRTNRSTRQRTEDRYPSPTSGGVLTITHVQGDTVFLSQGGHVFTFDLATRTFGRV